MGHFFGLVATFAVICPAVRFRANEPLAQIQPITGYPYKSLVSWKVVGDTRLCKSNGWPNYVITTGMFPNPHCPNTPEPQSYEFSMPVNPAKSKNAPIALGLQLFGVALNGVPFDPVANEYWDFDDVDTKEDNDYDQRTQTPPAKGEPYWTFEALKTKLKLGLDGNNAHVQGVPPEFKGPYHYHGMPTGLLKSLGVTFKATGFVMFMPKAMILLGYAADGFPIYSCYVKETEAAGATKQLVSVRELKSSWQLRNKGGTRAKGEPSGVFMKEPKGQGLNFVSNKYDGTFTQDYEYQEGSGDLDYYNGAFGATPEFPDKTYYYVITEEFPFLPRSFIGTPDKSFEVHDHQMLAHDLAQCGREMLNWLRCL